MKKIQFVCHEMNTDNLQSKLANGLSDCPGFFAEDADTRLYFSTERIEDNAHLNKVHKNVHKIL